MSSSEEVSTFLPSLEMARAEEAKPRARVWWRRGGIDLLAREPSQQRKVAAVFVRARLRSAADGAPETLLRYPYVPSMPFALEEGVTRLLERLEDPAECLRVELERGGGDPYRGLPGAEPSFHGFGFAEALQRARTQIARLRAAHPREAVEVNTYACPILWLSYRGLVRRELALVVRPDGALHGMICKGRWL